MKFDYVKSDNDIKTLARLASEIWRSYWTIILSEDEIEYMIKKFQSYEAIKNQLKNEKYIYKILKEGNECLGYFGVYKTSEPYELFSLSKIYLKDGCRGRGLGTFMFKEIKKIAQDMGLKKIRLYVNKRNSVSIKAYEKWGFKIIEAIVKDIGDGYVMDDYVMECEINT